MRILDRTFNAIGRAKAQIEMGYLKAAIDNPPRFLSEQARVYEHQYIGEPYRTETQEDLYATVSWIQNAVHLVASVAATTAITVNRRDDDGNVDIENHEFEFLLRKPNPVQSQYEFIYSLMAWKKVTGNAYIYLNKASEDSAPDEMWMIPTHQIRPVASKETFVGGYLYNPGDGIEIPIEAHEIVHLKTWNPKSPYVGLSVMESLFNAAVHDRSASEWNKNFFAKDNAKPTGVMAFSSQINPTSWEQIKNTVSAEYGGSRRKLMLLQGVGQGAVNFIPTMLSHTDMALLESRKFNRDEIFNAIAPGSAAMVDVNATEANSKTGRDVFFSIGVWPELSALSQKFTSDILPYYGDGLVCEFNDVRQRDIALEIQQIATFALTHTINEVRQEWYNDDPLDDERGNLFVAEISPATVQPDAQPEEPKQIPDANSDEMKATLSELIAEVKALKAVTTFQPTTFTIDTSPVATEPAYTIAQPQRISGPTQAETDLGLWQKKAINRAAKGRSIAVKFESDAIPEAVKAFVTFGLDRGDDVPELFNTAKMILQLDPDDDESEYQLRFTIEVQEIDRLQKALGAQFDKFQEMLNSGDIDTAEMNRIISTLADDTLLYDALQRTLVVAADLGVTVGIRQLDNVGIGFDWTLANADAREWARENAGVLIKDINATTSRSVRNALANWIDNSEDFGELVSEMERIFGYDRAELIASTEATRAYAEGSRLSYYYSGVVETIQWMTANDERVCPICAPLGGLNYGAESNARTSVENPSFTHPGGLGPAERHTGKNYRLPPSHPRCRCWIAAVIDVD